jgi:hypothetical protein
MEFSRSASEYKQCAREVTDLLRNQYLSADGVFIMGKVGDVLNHEYIVDDFGDVAPFIALYGGEDMCLSHLDYIEQNVAELGFDRAFAYTDLILGLLWYARNGGQYSSRAYALAERLLAQVQRRWYVGEAVYSIAKFQRPLPITNGIDSTYVEVWTEAYRDVRSDEYRQMVVKTFNYFERVRHANTAKLIPKHHFPWWSRLPARLVFPKKYHEAHVMKDNTNYLFGLLDMMRLDISADAARVAFSDLHSRLGLYAEKNELNNHLISGQQSDLLCSFAFIDVSADAFKLTGDMSYLTPAKTLANHWIDSDKSTTGLFPSHFGGNESYFDSETDMAVALLKLYECTGHSNYLKKADELMEGILHYHRKEDGFVLQVDINSGEVTTRNYKTKFIALFLKALHVFSEGGRVYEDEKLFTLAKDR